MADSKEPTLKKDQRVRVLIGGPNNEVVDGTVRIVQDEVGKLIGVELDNYVETGHTLDDKLDTPVKTDEGSGRIFGKGWWTRPEHVEVL